MTVMFRKRRVRALVSTLLWPLLVAMLAMTAVAAAAPAAAASTARRGTGQCRPCPARRATRPGGRPYLGSAAVAGGHHHHYAARRVRRPAPSSGTWRRIARAPV